MRENHLRSSISVAKGTNEIAQVMKLEKSADGYLKEYHARLNPIDTKTFGIYIAGMAQGPKAIDASVSYWTLKLSTGGGTSLICVICHRSLPDSLLVTASRCSIKIVSGTHLPDTVW
jgi:hypothetical protein